MKRHEAVNIARRTIAIMELHAKIEGLNEGLTVAQRIATWHGVNHTLEKPHSREKLLRWSEESIRDLRNMIARLHDDIKAIEKDLHNATAC